MTCVRQNAPPRAPWRGVLAGLLLVGLLLGPRSPATAGPLEARALWEEAKATTKGPWPARVRALRAVVEACYPTDRVRARALSALAATLRKAQLPHGAMAFEARAASQGARRDRRRIDAELRLASALRREMDLHAAATHLRAVAEDGRRVAPRNAERALGLLAEDAFETGDEAALTDTYRRLLATRARPDLRLEALGWLGLLRLAAGDRPRAERTYRAARTLYERAARDDADAVRCARIWLDYPLRRALQAAASERPP